MKDGESDLKKFRQDFGDYLDEDEMENGEGLSGT